VNYLGFLRLIIWNLALRLCAFAWNNCSQRRKAAKFLIIEMVSLSWWSFLS